MAPPCGTASAARIIQFSDDTDLPQPLRSKECHDGLPDLSGIDFLRVAQSNILYDFSATVYDLCCELDKLCICENPRDSLYWDTTPWVERVFFLRDCIQCHQACAYGSGRPKWTKLMANFPEIEQISGVCDGKRKHQPWGYSFVDGKRVFATSLEVHYPLALCSKIANTIALALQKSDEPWVKGFVTPLQPSLGRVTPVVRCCRPSKRSLQFSNNARETG